VDGSLRFSEGRWGGVLYGEGRNAFLRLVLGEALRYVNLWGKREIKLDVEFATRLALYLFGWVARGPNGMCEIEKGRHCCDAVDLTRCNDGTRQLCHS